MDNGDDPRSHVCEGVSVRIIAKGVGCTCFAQETFAGQDLHYLQDIHHCTAPTTRATRKRRFGREIGPC